MNRTLRNLLNLCVIIILVYFLVWPFINSAISHKYYLKTATDGYPSQSYTTEVGEGYITAEISYYNNVATEKQAPESSTSYENSLAPETYDKIAAAINAYKGFHLFARRHSGYAFYYESVNNGAMFFSNEDKADLLELNQILTDIARGDEKYPNKRNTTYEKQGLSKLDAFIEEKNVLL